MNTMHEVLTVEQARQLPKAELHIHLDSAFEVDDIVRIAGENGVPLLREPSQLLVWDNLQDFLTFLDWALSLPGNRDQVASLAYSVAQRQKRSGVRYTELMVSPVHWTRYAGRLANFVEDLDYGLTSAESDGCPPVNLSISLSRGNSQEEAQAILDVLLEMQHPRVVALSIDGNEALSGRTGERFAPVFERAAANGLGITVHAGESSGPEGVWDAIDLLESRRVDHGVRSVEDPKLVQELIRRGTTLNVCPYSNILMGVYPDRESHPVGRLVEMGVRVTINTDGPGFFQITLEDEYVAAAETYGWDSTVIRKIARTSVEASFCPEPLKSELLAEVDSFSFSD
jgi:adenosine deaminase